MKNELLKEKFSELYGLLTEFEDVIYMMEDGRIKLICEAETAMMLEFTNTWYKLIREEEERNN